jgi:hypothetical protein
MASTDVYELITAGVKRLADAANIPNNPSNRDWIDYQAWLNAGNTPRPKQPDPTYVWDGTKWVQDPTLAAQANNNSLQESLNSNDAETIRSLRTVVTSLARLSPAYPPAANTDSKFLLDGEQQAQQLRNQWRPPAAPTLAEAKTRKNELLRIQGLAYLQIGFIAQTFRWNTKQIEPNLYMTLTGYLPAGNLMLDGKAHIWDSSGVERILTSLNASKLAGALQQWAYLAQKEYWTKVAEVNACTTVAQVNAVTWTPVYTDANPWNADTYKPPLVLETLPAQ